MLLTLWLQVLSSLNQTLKVSDEQQKESGVSVESYVWQKQMSYIQSEMRANRDVIAMTELTLYKKHMLMALLTSHSQYSRYELITGNGDVAVLMKRGFGKQVDIVSDSIKKMPRIQMVCVETTNKYRKSKKKDLLFVVHYKVMSKDTKKKAADALTQLYESVVDQYREITLLGDFNGLIPECVFSYGETYQDHGGTTDIREEKSTDKKSKDAKHQEDVVAGATGVFAKRKFRIKTTAFNHRYHERNDLGVSNSSYWVTTDAKHIPKKADCLLQLKNTLYYGLDHPITWVLMNGYTATLLPLISKIDCTMSNAGMTFDPESLKPPDCVQYEEQFKKFLSALICMDFEVYVKGGHAFMMLLLKKLNEAKKKGTVSDENYEEALSMILTKNTDLDFSCKVNSSNRDLFTSMAEFYGFILTESSVVITRTKHFFWSDTNYVVRISNDNFSYMMELSALTENQLPESPITNIMYKMDKKDWMGYIDISMLLKNGVLGDELAKMLDELPQENFFIPYAKEGFFIKDGIKESFLKNFKNDPARLTRVDKLREASDMIIKLKVLGVLSEGDKMIKLIINPVDMKKEIYIYIVSIFKHVFNPKVIYKIIDVGRINENIKVDDDIDFLRSLVEDMIPNIKLEVQRKYLNTIIGSIRGLEQKNDSKHVNRLNHLKCEQCRVDKEVYTLEALIKANDTTQPPRKVNLLMKEVRNNLVKQTGETPKCHRFVPTRKDIEVCREFMRILKVVYNMMDAMRIPSSSLHNASLAAALLNIRSRLEEWDVLLSE